MLLHFKEMETFINIYNKYLNYFNEKLLNIIHTSTIENFILYNVRKNKILYNINMFKILSLNTQIIDPVQYHSISAL